MSGAQSITDAECVNKQYRDASKLNARLRLHQQCSTNKYGWQRWLFDQFKFPLRGSVLELGCGTGNLWFENADRLPAGLEIILSDLSAGMVEQTRHNLGTSQSHFQFEVVDAQSIPFGDGVFDIVIANHMLYHMPERALALREIRRVLKADGQFYASTIGKNHLKELSLLVKGFDSGLTSWGKLPSDSFSLENGTAQLGEYFSSVSLHYYKDSLIVSDAALLADYILSGIIDSTSDKYKALAKYLTKEIQAGDGKLHITKDWGVFESIGLHF